MCQIHRTQLLGDVRTMAAMAANGRKYNKMMSVMEAVDAAFTSIVIIR